MKRRILDPRGPVLKFRGMLVDDHRTSVHPTLLMPRTSTANFRVGAVCGDAIEPGAEGRITSERVDLPRHAQDRVLDDFLGIWAAAGDAHGQAVDTISVQSDQRLHSPGLMPAQRFHQICVAIRAPSRITERQLSHFDSLPWEVVLPLPRLYRVTVSGSSPTPWKMA